MPRCAPVTGAEAFGSTPNGRYFVVGDYHGTREVPAFFANLVCLALKRDKLVVGLEWPSTAQAGLDAYLRSNDDATAKAKLMSQPELQLLDGRTSEAMFDLVERLWAYSKAGRLLGIVAIQPVDGAVQLGGTYEAEMAASIVETARRNPDAKIYILVGNIHAMRRPPAAAVALKPMATQLPATETVSINTKLYLGSAWDCVAVDGQKRPQCGPHDLGKQGVGMAIGIVMDPTRLDIYDGRYSVGSPFSPSPSACTKARCEIR